jgi:hypothetical protein
MGGAANPTIRIGSSATMAMAAGERAPIAAGIFVALGSWLLEG